MKTLTTLTLTAALMMTACATTPMTALVTPYDSTAQMVEAGSNTITGSAFLTTMGGDVKTCAGGNAYLVRSTPYSRERILNIYQNIDGGFMRAASSRDNFANDDPEYQRAIRSTPCDAQGNFTFDGLGDGEYFVSAQVTWSRPQGELVWTEGGSIMRRVSVQGGETKRIIINGN